MPLRHTCPALVFRVARTHLLYLRTTEFHTFHLLQWSGKPHTACRLVTCRPRLLLWFERPQQSYKGRILFPLLSHGSKYLQVHKSLLSIWSPFFSIKRHLVYLAESNHQAPSTHLIMQSLSHQHCLCLPSLRNDSNSTGACANELGCV